MKYFKLISMFRFQAHRLKRNFGFKTIWETTGNYNIRVSEWRKMLNNKWTRYYRLILKHNVPGGYLIPNDFLEKIYQVFDFIEMFERN